MRLSQRLNLAPWPRTAAFLFTAFLITRVAVAEFPPESLQALETAKQHVAQGDWGGAIDAYTEHLRNLTTRDFRDKKTYDWILEAYEKAAPDGKPDYGALKKLARDRLPKFRGARIDPMSAWRLHALLASIAQKEGNTVELQQDLSQAILTYPNVAYADPAAQSRLQHLYNDLAFAKAKLNVVTGENYLVESYQRDTRFAFVYLKPWKDFYAAAGAPERYEGIVKRVIEAAERKAQRDPAQADTLTHFRRQYAEELSPKPETAAAQAAPTP